MVHQRHKISQRRIAAAILGCGTSRVWLDPTAAAKIAAAITRADIRRLIADGKIKKLPETGTGIAGKKRYQRAGSRKGAKGARRGKKTGWFKVVRAQRDELAKLRPRLKPLAYRKVYRMIKGGFFRSRAHLRMYLRNKGLIKEVD